MKIGRALGVEVEDLGRVGREAEAVVLGPQPDLVAAAAEDRDVERVDGRLEQDLGLGRRRRRQPSREEKRPLRHGIGLADESLERPVAAALDLARDVGQGRDRAEGSAAAGELEAVT